MLASLWSFFSPIYYTIGGMVFVVMFFLFLFSSILAPGSGGRSYLWLQALLLAAFVAALWPVGFVAALIWKLYKYLKNKRSQ